MYYLVINIFISLIILLAVLILKTIYNYILCKKNGISKEEFKRVKKEVSSANAQMIANKIVRIIFTVLTILLPILIIGTVVLVVIVLVLSIITLFGTAYVDTGEDPSGYIKLGSVTYFCICASVILINVWLYSLIAKIVMKQIAIAKRFH